jgi:selenocysteine-specific elongation factor
MKRIAKVLEELFQEKQQITVVDFRDRLKIGRNRVIFIIETFDKMGYTHRIIKQTKSKEVIDYRIIKNRNCY